MPAKVTLRARPLPALQSARRVLRRGGVLAVAGISRYLGVLKAGIGPVDAPASSLRTVIDIGHLGFIPAHFHTAAELRAEVEPAGCTDVTVYGVVGLPGHTLLVTCYGLYVTCRGDVLGIVFDRRRWLRDTARAVCPCHRS